MSVLSLSWQLTVGQYTNQHRCQLIFSNDKAVIDLVECDLSAVAIADALDEWSSKNSLAWQPVEDTGELDVAEHIQLVLSAQIISEETITVSQEKLIKACIQRILDCDGDDLMTHAGQLLGGEVFESDTDGEYTFVPTENYSGDLD